MRTRRPTGRAPTAVGAIIAFSLGLFIGHPATVAAQTCPDWNPERQPFFGDVHVHSALSFDAYAFEGRNGPRDAYRFARGESIGLPPLDTQGDPTRPLRLRRPLDFAAVTDHAEMLGETRLCTVGGLQTPACDAIRDGDFGLSARYFGDQFQSEDPIRRDFCGSDGALCLAVASNVWGDLAAAANEFDESDGGCGFTTFAGYEWTASPGSTLHRNVLFRGEDVPTLPLSYVEVQTPPALWAALESQCETVGGDCQALAIPHNSNQSSGQTFLTTEPDGSPMTRETALLARRMQPLFELVQHKGDSECRPGVDTTDEGCGFEKISGLPVAGDAPLSYVRNALKAGLALDAALGVNPFTLGLVASTDTHNATPGATEENDWVGHVGALDASPAARLSGGSLLQNPGGLMVLWSEENARDALFDAMLRRESYSTSGTRPTLRFFGGFDLPIGLCDAPDLIARGYATGVPMGGELASQPTSPAPRFVVQVAQDPGTPSFPGTPIAEIQIVKGWLEADGSLQERVVGIAGGPPGPNAVDPLSCATDGSGAATLCGEWLDPDFDPEEFAFYYTRVLESPTCRWSTLLCRDQGVDCSVAPPAELAGCCDGSVPETIQERATSSPIWLRPAPEPGMSASLALGALALCASPRRRRPGRQSRSGESCAPSAMPSAPSISASSRRAWR